jgi:secreted trypsin-like serine protease
MKRLSACLVSLGILLIVTSGAALSAPPPVNLTLSHTNSIDVNAFNTPSKSVSGANDVSASVQGIESSQCAPYGRQSSATGSATFSPQIQSDTEAKFSLHTSSYAQGGHFRTYSYSNSGVCVGIHGNDTRGTANAQASVVAEVRFNPSYLHPRDYALNISTAADGPPPQIIVTNSGGQAIYQGAQITNTMNLHGSPGAVYFINIKQQSEATNSGGCCSDSHATTATLDINVEPAPILASESLEGFIAGGNQTTAYKNVGALLIDGTMHCTGTLIDARTVLTAAHCLQGYENKITKMSFVLGSNYQAPEFGTPDPVADVDFPKGRPNDLSFTFNPQTYEDDIGIVHLQMPLTFSQSPLFAGTPSWQQIVANKISLDFVGFGFNVVGGQQVGLGIKREGTWQISQVENKRFGFAAQNGKNVCHGDSGGPAFFEGTTDLLLAGITSVGDQNCTVGLETKVDAYSGWITAHR